MKLTALDTLAAFIPSILASFISGNTPAGRTLLYLANNARPNAVPPFESCLFLYLNNRISREKYIELASMYGFSEDVADWMIASQARNYDLINYITLYRRGKIDKDYLFEIVKGSGLDATQLDNLLASTEYFPSAPDLIRFAVREVYTPNIVSKFGMSEDVPPQFIKEAGKAGLPEDQALNYWKAHWELPSTLQAFEMFQRRVIDKNTLDELLKSLDIMPYWRDKLTQIAYNPLTRVDVRRMYSLGVLNKEDVYNSYLDVGYSPDNAALMTEFTIKYENDEFEGVTRSNIVNAYEDDIITRDQFIDYLEGLGYTDKIIDFWVDVSDYNKTMARIKIKTNDIIELYRKGDIDLNSVRNELLALDLPQNYIDRILADIIEKTAERRKVPSKEDITQWLKDRIIDETYYVSRMRLLGYRDTDIRNYLTEIAMEQNTSDIRYLQPQVYQRWLKTGIMDEDTFRFTLWKMNFSEDDINRMVIESLGG